MIDNFPTFAKLVAAAFQNIAKQPNVFIIGIDGDTLYAAYLAAFPEGTNPKYKERTEHDCSCCRQFIKHAGSVAYVDNQDRVHTVWDTAAKEAEYPYNVVAQTLVTLMSERAISDLFRVGEKEASFGAVKNLAQLEDGSVKTWNHFHTGEIPKSLRHASPDQVKGEYRTTVQVFERGLKELKSDAVETVLDLIASDGLYRGEEHKSAILAFRKAQQAYTAKPEKSRNDFVWTQAHGPAARFKNTVIGTLVQDLSEGMEVDKAVKAFETKVAPANYQRPKAVITPGMVKKAMETIQSLGLEPALERRFAKIGDISVNDVKWVDGSVKPLMKGGLGDMLMQHAVKGSPPDTDRAEDISIDDFMSKVLPEATGMEVLFKGEHVGNLMSLTAPVHPEPKQLFKWDNDFSWSYNGNVADSIKERVKKAGGNVTNAKLRVSLSWFNFDDLDLHIYEPGATAGKEGHIYFRNKRSPSGGFLDVDMNAGSGTTREAVENVSWVNVKDGAYGVVVNNFALRETSNVGFVVEMENGGKLSHFTYSKGVRNGENVKVAALHVKKGVVEQIQIGDSSITTTAVSQEKWGLNTEQFVKVNAVTLSPNYWGDNAVGNKHTFFVLEGCLNNEPTRGIYNENLSPRLHEHRKVFEVIGDKTKCQPTEGQLSGLGFSSTQKDSVIVKVTSGKKQRLLNVHVG